jgi:Human adenovirus early E3A glycoprotein
VDAGLVVVRFMNRDAARRAVIPKRFALRTGFVAGLIAAVMLLTPLASGSGSGYNLSFTQTSGHASNSAVDLISLSSSDGGGLTISVTLQVSGTLNLASSHFVYIVYFGGQTQGSAVGYATVSNGTSAWLSSASGGGGFGFFSYTLGSGGSSLTFPMNKTDVGASSSFSMNAYAVYAPTTGSSNGATFSWLGTDYTGTGGGGGGTCSGNLSTCTQVVNNALTLATWIVISVVLLFVVIIVVVVLVVVMRRRRTPPPMMMGQPPQSQGMPPAPPPPPPPSA